MSVAVAGQRWCNTPMPNQPKTPARTFRLSDETIQKVDDMSQTLGTANRSETIRASVEMAQKMAGINKALVDFTSALGHGLPEGISLDAMVEGRISYESITAAGNASFLNGKMPTEEANRRLLAALEAARPFMVGEAAKAERERTLVDVLARAEGFKPEIPQLFIDHLKSLIADPAERGLTEVPRSGFSRFSRVVLGRSVLRGWANRNQAGEPVWQDIDAVLLGSSSPNYPHE
jgi:hypothetical protein